MKSIAFIFKSGPYGTSAGNECLDAILSISVINQNISVFFIGDGVFHLIKKQYPKKIFFNDYIKTLSVLPLYGINNYYICLESLKERNLEKEKILQFNKTLLQKTIFFKILDISKKLNEFNFILTF